MGMPPKVQQKSKETKALAAASGGKGKVREKAQNRTLFDKETYDRLISEVPKMKCITTSGLIERLKINGSLARKALPLLEEKGLIKCIVKNGSMRVYTRATKATKEDDED